jgi:hypothetical protein
LIAEAFENANRQAHTYVTKDTSGGKRKVELRHKKRKHKNKIKTERQKDKIKTETQKQNKNRRTKKQNKNGNTKKQNKNRRTKKTKYIRKHKNKIKTEGQKDKQGDPVLVVFFPPAELGRACRVARFFFAKTYQNGKIYQITTYTLYQTAMNYTKWP